MNADSLWQKRFAKCLKHQKLDFELLEYLDDIVDWYSRVNSFQDDDFLSSSIHQYTERGFRLRFEEVLSQLLIQHQSLLFPADMALDKGKRRYRMLIRIFHPDRGANDIKWLTARAEKINSAYKDFVDSHRVREQNGKLSSSKVLMSDYEYKAADRARSQALTIKVAQSVKSVAWLKAAYWRSVLGDPYRLQYKIAYSLAALVITILLVVALSIVLEPSNQAVSNKAQLKFNEQETVTVKETDLTADLNKNNVVLNEEFYISEVDEMAAAIDTKTTIPVPEQLETPQDSGSPNQDTVLDIVDVPDTDALDSVQNNEAVDNQISSSKPAVKDIEAEVEVEDKENAPANTKKRQDTNELVQNYYSNSISDPATQAVLLKYQSYFMAGDEQQLVTLYMNSAHENGMHGAVHIEQYYKELFSLTEQRAVKMDISNIEHDGFHSAQIIGQMQIDYSAGSSEFTAQRNFKMLLIKTQTGLKIALFDWMLK